MRGVFDEIVVVDTGSVDRTREIAREFGARVFEFTWIDDFAAARNEALAHATGDYAFWLDADDVVEPAQREKLPGVARRVAAGMSRPDTSCDCACDPGPDGSGGETVVDHVRLFPIRPDVHWTYRVHEQIMPALRRAGIPVRWTDLVVRHTGYVNLALRGRKLDRDTRILQEELKDRPDEPFILFNLGAIAIERRDWGGALGYLRRSLARSAPSDSITRKLFALIARAHQMLGDSGAALRTCAEGLAIDPDDAELCFRKAVVHRHRGEPAEAEACWRRILGLRRPERFASVDMGIYGHLTRRNLAVLAAERGDRDEAAEHLADGARRVPRRPRGTRDAGTAPALMNASIGAVPGKLMCLVQDFSIGRGFADAWESLVLRPVTAMGLEPAATRVAPGPIANLWTGSRRLTVAWRTLEAVSRRTPLDPLTGVGFFRLAARSPEGNRCYIMTLR